MIKGVIFDIDGVLLDSLGIWDDLGARYLVSIGVEPEEGLNEILFSMSMEQGAAYLNEHYRLQKTDTEILTGISKMIEAFYFDEVLPKSGAKELLEFMKAKGIRMTAATSSPRIHVEKALERNGMLGFLERIFTNTEVGASKHSPEIYEQAAAYMGTKPEETLVFEDSLYALKTADDAGFVTVGVYDIKGETDREGVKNTGKYYVTELNEFPAVFETIK
ncbi:HAD family hydrolase [Butyrivibrio sp. AE2032]|uniref:HAD family hydrolase n=1 Tax=Butyrivibrio sp. AE2032 TaxID=1458463 RepID=UPI0005581D30|nr:HAD family phosphatase [Butyrivibrio sp. AE2032]